MQLENLVSAIQNNVVSGLGGAVQNNRFSLEQIEDSVINERLVIIKEYSLKNIIPKKDLMLSINCLPVDCEALDGCCNGLENSGKQTQHVQLPQIINDYGNEAIDYFGATDRQLEFTVYTNNQFTNHKYRRRGSNKPYVWIRTTPNLNNFYDAYIFNAPMLKKVTITAMFKDPRQLIDFTCCTPTEIYNMNFIDREIEKRVTESFIRYYRQLAVINMPNDQAAKL